MLCKSCSRYHQYDTYNNKPEQYAVFQHASLATLIQQSAPLDVCWFTELLLPRWQRDLNQVAPGIIWGISTVATRWNQSCDHGSPCSLTQPCHQLQSNKHTCKEIQVSCFIQYDNHCYSKDWGKVFRIYLFIHLLLISFHKVITVS